MALFVLGYLYLGNAFRGAAPFLLVIIVFAFKKTLLAVTGEGRGKNGVFDLDREKRKPKYMTIFTNSSLLFYHSAGGALFFQPCSGVSN